MEEVSRNMETRVGTAGVPSRTEANNPMAAASITATPTARMRRTGNRPTSRMFRAPVAMMPTEFTPNTSEYSRVLKPTTFCSTKGEAET